VTAGKARRILIVEDEFLVAMHLEDLLGEMGHHVVACAARMDKALKIAVEGDIDFAILDINLGGVKSYAVADALRRRSIPFLFASGYGPDGLPGEYSNVITLRKPYEPGELGRAIERASARLSG
jgi:DNA-binding response OmpR family regulator